MKTNRILILLSIVVFSINIGNAQKSEKDIKITITNVASNNGTIQIGLYNNEANFLNKTYRSITVKAKEGNVEASFKNVPTGEYAISLYHDADDNKKLNTILGIPTESYGTSNNAKGNFGPPKWEDARFTIKDKEIVQSISL